MFKLQCFDVMGNYYSNYSVLMLWVGYCRSMIVFSLGYNCLSRKVTMIVSWVGYYCSMIVLRLDYYCSMEHVMDWFLLLNDSFIGGIQLFTGPGQMEL